MKKRTSPNQKQDAPITNSDTTVATQRLEIIALLKQHQSMSTPEFREHGIMQPASRILELKERGHRIEKALENYVDNTGREHNRVARYYFANNPPANDSEAEAVA
jgi:hypothetical protein